MGYNLEKYLETNYTFTIKYDIWAWVLFIILVRDY